MIKTKERKTYEKERKENIKALYAAGFLGLVIMCLFLQIMSQNTLNATLFNITFYAVIGLVYAVIWCICLKDVIERINSYTEFGITYKSPL